MEEQTNYTEWQMLSDLTLRYVAFLRGSGSGDKQIDIGHARQLELKITTYIGYGEVL
jgi:hypothetical protein